ncbi:MAG: NAD(P)(+) transhydrogenase (Re/Si-specific) subunit beta [Hyphomicrobiales bacterium]
MRRVFGLRRRWCWPRSTSSAASSSPNACSPCTRKKTSEALRCPSISPPSLYLVSGILFILALRGLSHPTTSRQGNMYGMIGMAIAVVTTLLVADPGHRRPGS